MGKEPRVLPMATEGARADTRARLFVAALVAPASIVLLSDPTTLRVVVGGMGLLISLAYVAGARKAKRTVVTERLILDGSGITWSRAEDERSIAWRDVTGFDVHPDASTLLVLVEGAEPLAIAPGFGGLGTIELHALLQRERDGAIDPDRG